MRVRADLLLWLIAASMPAAHVEAHAPPQIFQVAFDPHGERVALVTNRGLLFGDANAMRFRLLCHEALEIGGSELPDIALLADGEVLVATSKGLRRTKDDGCSWERVPLLGDLPMAALAQAPHEPATLLGAVGEGDGRGIYLSSDGGDHWERWFEPAQHDAIEDLLLAPADAAVVYVSGRVVADDGIEHYVARSNDGGATFARHALPLLETEADGALLAVSPTDPDRVLVVARDNSASTTARRDRLLVSDDGGRSWTSALTVSGLNAAAFSADGTTAWVAANTGLWRSLDAGLTFEQVPGPSWMSSAFERDGVLWACGYYQPGADGIGLSSDGAASFTQWMAFTHVTAPASCDADEPLAPCAALWRDWQFEILGVRDGDAGVAPAADASTSGGPARDAGRDPRRGGSGCSAATHGAGRVRPLAALGALAALALRRRKRRGKS